jgi:putative ABC transport system permease protein
MAVQARLMGGALALMTVALHGGPAGGQAMALNVPLAVAAFGPLLVPVVARMLPVGLGGPIGGLARPTGAMPAAVSRVYGESDTPSQPS